LSFIGFWQYAWKVAWATEKSVEFSAVFAYCQYFVVNFNTDGTKGTQRSQRKKQVIAV